MTDTPAPLTAHLRADGVSVISAPSMLDKDGAPQLRNRFVALAAERATPRIVVDLGAVEFIDSVGLGVLVGGLKRAKARGGEFALADIRERVLGAFRASGMLQHFTVYESASAAVEALRPDGA